MIGQHVSAACALGAGLIALQVNLIFAIWIKYMPGGLGTAPLTTPVASTAILAIGLAYLLAANARWAPFLGSVDAKLAATLGKVRWAGHCWVGCHGAEQLPTRHCCWQQLSSARWPPRVVKSMCLAT